MLGQWALTLRRRLIEGARQHINRRFAESFIELPVNNSEADLPSKKPVKGVSALFQVWNSFALGHVCLWRDAHLMR